MIKLVNLIREIKIQGRITPEMIDELDLKIWKKSNQYQQLELLNFFRSEMEWNQYRYGFNDWLRILNQKELNKLYKFLLNFKAKNNL